MNFRSPLTKAGRSPRRAAALVMLSTVTACAVWALRPVPGIEDAEQPVPAPMFEGNAPKSTATVDLAAFSVPLWVARSPEPPALAAAPASPPPPPPLRLQLLAIVREGESLRAVIYDQDTDRLVIAGAGDEVHGARVEEITDDGLVLRIEGGTRALTLARGHGGGA